MHSSAVVRYRLVEGWQCKSFTILTHLLGIQVKTDEFFGTIADLMTLIEKESLNNVLCNVILLVNLLRVQFLYICALLIAVLCRMP